MMRQVLFGVTMLVAIAAVAAGTGCGDDDPADSGRHEGAAALAAAQFWQQEAAGGRLPGGIGVTAIGANESGIRALDVSEQAGGGADARVCVPFEYRLTESPFTQHVRVYIATLQDGSWRVESVKDDGNCDDVL